MTTSIELSRPQGDLLRRIGESCPLPRVLGDGDMILSLVRMGAVRLQPPYNTYRGCVPADAQVGMTPLGRELLLGV